MCWQTLSLKNPDSQTLLAASEQERLTNCQRASPYSQRPARDENQVYRFGASYGDDSDFEDRIMQHLAISAMGRSPDLVRRGESLRYRPSPALGLPHIMGEPARSNSPSAQLSSSAAVAFTGGFSPPSPTSIPGTGGFDSTSEQATPRWSTSTYSHSIPSRARGPRSVDSSSTDSSSIRRVALLDPAEEIHHGTTSETFKSRLAAASSKYRDSLSKTTRGLRERLRLRNGAIAELGARAREVSAGVVRALEQISREPPERDTSSSPSSRADTTLARTGLSLGSDRSDQECSSSSLGERFNLSSVGASSIPNSSQPSTVEGSHCLDSRPMKGLTTEDVSRQGHPIRQTPAGPLPI